MSTTVKTGWLNDKNGDKFAPKTLTSQVQMSDGTLLEDKLRNDLEVKVDKVDGKGLSTNDFTDEYKSKVDSAMQSYTETDPTVPTWAKAATKPNYATSELTNDIGFITIGDVSIITIPEIDAICIIPLDPGLYQDGVMTMSWDELIENGIINVYDGAMYSTDKTVDGLVGDFVIDASITSLEQAHMGCSSLTSVTIPDGVTYLAGVEFEDCTNLIQVTVSENLTSIGESCFSGCSSLKEFVFSSKINAIYANAFARTGLEHVSVPSGIIADSIGAFSGCPNLQTVVIGDEVTSLPTAIFSECTALTSVTIPASVINIDQEAFAGCTVLSSITFNGTMTQWNAVSKNDYWCVGSALSKIVCSDGTVTL